MSHQSMTIDPGVLQELVELGREIEEDVLGDVVSTHRKATPELLAEIVGAWNARAFERLRKAAHALKGASAQVGATSLSELARQVELEARAERDDGLAVLIECCRAEAAAVDAALESYLEDRSS